MTVRKIKTETRVTTGRTNDIKESPNLNMQISYALSIKYIGYMGKELVKSKRYGTIKEGTSEMNKVIKKINKDGGLDFSYKFGTVKKLFVFQSNILNTSLREIDISERVVNVKNLLLKRRKAKK